MCSSSPIAFLLLYSSRHGDHRDLHSFPTRRSSDLKDTCGRPAVGPRLIAIRGGRWGSRVDAGTPPPSPNGDQRSEEHTSELQSLRQLVCRLLLEKKKKKRYHRRPPHDSMDIACYNS